MSGVINVSGELKEAARKPPARPPAGYRKKASPPAVSRLCSCPEAAGARRLSIS